MAEAAQRLDCFPCPPSLTTAPDNRHPPSQGVRIVLNPSKPKLTVLSTSSACGDGATESADCAGQFLLTSLKDVFEIAAAGTKVSNREAKDVLDLSQARGGGRLVLWSGGSGTLFDSPG